MESVSKELNNIITTISNLEKLLAHSLEKLKNLNQIWAFSDWGNRRIQKKLFPEGVYYKAKNHEYLTTKTNAFIHMASRISTSYGENKNGNFQFDIENSHSVVRIGELSNQYVQDFLLFCELLA